MTTRYALFGAKVKGYVVGLVGVYQTKHNAQDAAVRLKLRNWRVEAVEWED